MIPVYSHAKSKAIPVMCREKHTDLSWISRDIAQRLEEQPKSKPTSVTEQVGETILESIGTVSLWYTPHNCMNTIQGIFHVHDQPDGPEMYIGKEGMQKIEKKRQNSIRYDFRQRTYSFHASSIF